MQNVLWIEIEVRAVDLIEPPEEVLGGTIDVIASGVVGEVVAERGFGEFLFEEINLVEE